MSEAAIVDAQPNRKLSYTRRLRWNAAGRVAVFTMIAAVVFGAIYWGRLPDQPDTTDPLWTVEAASPVAYSETGNELLCNVGLIPTTALMAFDADTGKELKKAAASHRAAAAMMADGTVITTAKRGGPVANSVDLIRPDGTRVNIPIPISQKEFLAVLPPDQAAAAANSLTTLPLNMSVIQIDPAPDGKGVIVRGHVFGSGFGVSGSVILTAEIDAATETVRSQSYARSMDPYATSPYGMRYAGAAVRALTEFGVPNDECPKATDSILRTARRPQAAAAVFNDEGVIRARIWRRRDGVVSMAADLVLPLSRGLLQAETPVLLLLSPDGTRLAVGTVGGAGGQTVYVFDVSTD